MVLAVATVEDVVVYSGIPTKAQFGTWPPAPGRRI